MSKSTVKLSSFVVTVLVLQSSSFTFSSAQRAGTIIPLYLWPSENSQGVHNWQPLVDAKRAYPQVPAYAIVNVQNGPGFSVSPEYTTSLKKLLDAGIETLGYVLTGYGQRATAEVQADVDRWISYYPNSIRGIFFDEMAYENKPTTEGRLTKEAKSTADYYTDLSRYAKTRGLNFTVGNPGTDTSRDFVQSVDTIIIFETNTGFPGEDRLGGWHTELAREKWGIMPYAIGQFNPDDVRNAKRFVQYIFVTDDNLPNPWDSLPQYLNQLFSVLNEN